MDLSSIEAAITELENSDTTVENVAELASLYICKDNLERSLNLMVDSVEEELNDVLPYYMKYRDTKRRYQLNEAIDSEVIQGIKDVCRELKEFINMMYYGTDMNKERICIRDMIHELAEKYKD